jgi:hypothetical protein
MGFLPEINIHDPFINEQIKLWQPIMWTVIMEIEPPIIATPNFRVSFFAFQGNQLIIPFLLFFSPFSSQCLIYF